MVDSLVLIENPQSPLEHLIDSLAPKDPYLHVGERFDTDSLSVARTRIVNKLRNQGYYYFRPEYIEFLADSTIHPGSIALKMVIADGVPAPALRKYYTGDVTINVMRHSSKEPGFPDTISDPKADVIVWRPARLRKICSPRASPSARGAPSRCETWTAPKPASPALAFSLQLTCRCFPPTLPPAATP